MGLELSTPGFLGTLVVGGIIMPAYISGGVDAPENLVTPQVTGAYAPYHYAPGFTNPTVTASILVRDTAGECLNASFLTWLFARDGNYDTEYIPGGVTYWDGARGKVLQGAKFDSMSLRIAKGQPLVMQCRFCGSNALANAAVPSAGQLAIIDATAPAPPPFNANPPILGNDVLWNINSAQFSGFWDASFTYSNNHAPDMGDDGTKFPRAQRASTPQSSLSGTRISSVVLPTDTAGVEASIGFQIIGTGRTASITIGRAVDQIRANVQAGMPQSMKPCSFMAFSPDGRTQQAAWTSSGF